MFKNTLMSYGSVAKFFHWFIFILILCMLIFGYFLEDIPKPYQGLTYNIHKLVGLLMMVLMFLRGLWALTQTKPELPANTLWWQRSAERVVHYVLYLLIIAMPLAGWVGSSAAGRPPHLFKIKLDLPVPQNEALVEAAFDTHYLISILIIIFISIHVLAALYHYFIKKDNILQRMLPE